MRLFIYSLTVFFEPLLSGIVAPNTLSSPNCHLKHNLAVSVDGVAQSPSLFFREHVASKNYTIPSWLGREEEKILGVEFEI